MSLDLNLNKILIIDFGSQFTQLIVRRIRELGVFSEIVSHKIITSSQIKTNIKGIILETYGAGNALSGFMEKSPVLQSLLEKFLNANSEKQIADKKDS